MSVSPGYAGGRRRAALGAVVVSLLVIAGAYLSVALSGAAVRWASWGLAIGTSVLCAALTALGAARRDRTAWAFAVPVGVIGTVMAAGFAAALVLPDAGAAERIVLGLPLRAAIVIYGVGVLPVFVLPLFYGRTFESLVLSDEDIARVRADAAAAREVHEP